MVVVQVRRVNCSKCGTRVPMHVYRPKAQLLVEGIRHGIIDELTDEALKRALIRAQEIDAEEQASGEVEDAARLIQESGGVFVDGRKCQAVCCSHLLYYSLYARRVTGDRPPHRTVRLAVLEGAVPCED